MLNIVVVVFCLFDVVSKNNNNKNEY